MFPLTLSVLIPAKDEADNLEALLNEIIQVLERFFATKDKSDKEGTPWNTRIHYHERSIDTMRKIATTREYEIIVVDDASTDKTGELLSRLSRRHPQLKTIQHDHARGQSTSIWEAAHSARGKWLVTLDGDGQNDPADIPAMLAEACASDIDMVAGYRFHRRATLLKRISSRTANCIRASLLSDNTPDTGCGLKLMRRDAFLALPYFDHMHRFLPALMQGQGRNCISLPVNDRPRQYGRSHYGVNNRLWVGIIDMIGVMWLNRRSRLPLSERPAKDVKASSKTAIFTPDGTLRSSTLDNPLAK
ncbi:Undecaprenyl-phosphate 4-deoxy-4-formamido-L-arabinose transferase [Halomonadaceae bacterium LMG 33818]|uniref:glycosyltransferase family 2 protein n=1 Tax=Cernens ardua TaxID=3402176 RepID=UPI003EDCA55A